MIVEYIRYEIPATDAEGFEGAYRTASESLDSSVHCLGYELSRCVEAPDSYILRIEWDSLEGHERGFRLSTRFPSFFAAVQPYMGQITEMRHYEMTSVYTDKCTEVAA